MTRLPGPAIAAGLLYAASVVLSGCGDDSGDSEGGEAGSTSTGGDTGSGGSAARDPTFPGMGGALTATTEGVFFVNEVMPSNHATIQDEGGSYPDWLEIYNAADGPASLGDYWIGDDPSEPYRAQLSADLVVPAQGVILLFADSDPEQGTHHLPFDLDRDGNAVILSDPDGQQIDMIEWTTVAPQDQSYARSADGGGSFVWCAMPTPGQLNGATCAQ